MSTQQVEIVASLLEELAARSGLASALGKPVLRLLRGWALQSLAFVTHYACLSCLLGFSAPFIGLVQLEGFV